MRITRSEQLCFVFMYPIKKESPQRMLELMRMGHPDNKGELYSRFEVMHEIEERGEKALTDIRWPVDLKGKYRNIHTGDESTFSDLTSEKEWGLKHELWSILEHWEPDIGLNTVKISKLKNQLKAWEDYKEKYSRRKKAKADHNNIPFADDAHLAYGQKYDINERITTAARDLKQCLKKEKSCISTKI